MSPEHKPFSNSSPAIPTAMPNVFPTRKRDWAKQGDTVISLGGMTGVVLKVVPIRTLPVAVVRWTNGHEGRITITNIRVVPNA